ncbi:hypothetical protein RJZ90_001416 [Blastomyces dermatitidis]
MERASWNPPWKPWKLTPQLIGRGARLDWIARMGMEHSESDPAVITVFFWNFLPQIFPF